MPDRQIERIAIERIKTLFKRAEETFPSDPNLAQRYVDLARKIAMRTRLCLPIELRRRVCRYCNTFLVPGATSRIRIKQRREPHVNITCLKCGKTTRIPIRGRNS
jgi:ribonuclease P protein subunit RPR2